MFCYLCSYSCNIWDRYSIPSNHHSSRRNNFLQWRFCPLNRHYRNRLLMLYWCTDYTQLRYYRRG